MQVVRAVLTFTLAAGGLGIGVFRAAEDPNRTLVTRVMYLKGMEVRDAATLLRSEVSVRRCVWLQERSAVVVADIPERVDQSERLLRQRGVVSRSTDPHGRLDLVLLADEPLATWTFRAVPSGVGDAETVLRTIFDARNLNRSPEEYGFTFQAPQPILDAGKAVLRELKLLAEESLG